MLITLLQKYIFSQQKEAEINALQRFQLLLYGTYYIQFYCKTINS